MQKTIYEFNSYKSFLLAWLKASPKKGRGIISRISKASQVHITTLSQILHGDRQLSLEQADLVARHLGLSEAEREYFVLLVNVERAGTVSLREMFIKQVQIRQAAQKNLVNRVVRSRELSSEEKAIFYSNWIYSAVRNVTAIPGYNNLTAIAQRLRLDPDILSPILDFLLGSGLCVKQNSEIAPGPQLTHLEGSSPLITRHHGNWRVKAMERHPMIGSKWDELAYSSPVTLSNEDVQRVRALLAELVQRTNQIVRASPSERLFCLNLDWFEVI